LTGSVGVGDGPYSLEIVGQNAFVANLFPVSEDDPNVVEVDLVSQSVINQFRVGRRAFQLEAFDRFLLVINGDKDYLTVVDRQTGAFETQVPVGSRPSGLATFLPAASTSALSFGRPSGLNYPVAIVANGSSGDLTVIDLRNFMESATIPVGRDPRAVAVHPGGSYAYVVLGGDNQLGVVDLAARTVVRRLPVGTDPVAVAVSAEGRRIIVANLTNNTVSLFDSSDPGNPKALSSAASSPQLPVGVQPTALAITPDGTRAFSANLGSNWITVINLQTVKVEGIVRIQREGQAVLTSATAVGVTDDGRSLLVLERGNDARLLLFDIADLELEPLPPVEIPGEPDAEIFLNTDSGQSCPGFYIAGLTLLPGAGEGAWGMEILTTAGNRLLEGGLNLGGAFDAAGKNPGFTAFNIANRRSEPQVVDLQVQAQALATPGFHPENLGIEVQFFNSKREPVTQPLAGPPPFSVTAVLNPGFYIARIKSTPLSPRGTFQVSMVTRFVDRPGGGFQGGVNIGGFLARKPDGTSTTGYAAFCIADPQLVSFDTEGATSRGSSGAGPMSLVVKDRNREVVRSVINTIQPPPDFEFPEPPDLEGQVPDLYVDASAASGGDGTAGRPFRSITEAVGKRAGPGDLILVRPGIYSPSRTGEVIPIGSPGIGLSRIPERVRLIGSGPSVCVIDAEGATRGGQNLNAVGIGSNSVQLSGFTIRGASAAGVYVLNAAGVVFEKNVLTENTRFGIGASNSPGLLVADNIAFSNGETGIAVSAAELRQDAPADPDCPPDYGACIVRNSTTDHRADGILVASGGHYVIAKNQAFNNGVSGIELNNGSEPGSTNPPLVGYVRDNTTGDNGGVQFAFAGTGILVTEKAHAEEITGNVVTNNRPGGIAIFEDSTASTVSGNTILNSQQNGLIVQKRSTVELADSNIITESGLSGVFVEDDSLLSNLTGSTLRRNGHCSQCTAAKGGVSVLDHSSISWLHDCIIDENALGIQVAGFSSIPLIENSTVEKNLQAGVMVRQSSSVGKFSSGWVRLNRGQGGFLISDSSITIDTSEIAANFSTGIILYEGAEAAVRESLVSGNTGSGISVLSGSVLNVVGTEIRENTQVGINANGIGSTGSLSGSTVAGNKIRGLVAESGAAIECLGSNTIFGNGVSDFFGNIVGCP